MPRGARRPAAGPAVGRRPCRDERRLRGSRFAARAGRRWDGARAATNARGDGHASRRALAGGGAAPEPRGAPPSQRNLRAKVPPRPSLLFLLPLASPPFPPSVFLPPPPRPAVPQLPRASPLWESNP